MKIQFTISKDVIHIDDITDEHIIVAKLDSRSYILTRDDYGKGGFRFRCLSSEFTTGNYFGYEPSVKSAIMKAKKVIDSDAEFAAFIDWRDALKWLL